MVNSVVYFASTLHFALAEIDTWGYHNQWWILGWRVLPASSINISLCLWASHCCWEVTCHLTVAPLKEIVVSRLLSYFLLTLAFWGSQGGSWAWVYLHSAFLSTAYYLTVLRTPQPCSSQLLPLLHSHLFSSKNSFFSLCLFCIISFHWFNLL
jgi:hypothetical protein